jgi:hypothetical protein
MRHAPALTASWAGRDVPEPQAINVYPARADAVCVPSAMPTMPVLPVPNVPIVSSSNDIVGVNILSDVHGFIDVDVFMVLSVRRCRGSESKRGKNGKDD